MTQPLGGLWPAVVTPTHADGSPNYQAVEQLVDLFRQQQLGGLYLTGSTGQWPLFTVEERKQVAERAVKVADGRIPVMVHVGAATTADSIELARHAGQIGADAISAVGPIYYGYTIDNLFYHYRSIASAVDLPLYVYHLQNVSQTSIPAKTYVERLLEIPTVAGMKITDRDLYPFGLIRVYAGERYTLFSGADELLCHGVLSGANGAIGTFYNVWGPACQAAWQATANGDSARGQEFMRRFQPAIDTVIASGGLWSFLRAAMRIKYQIDIGMPRPPLGATDKAWIDQEVEAILAQVDG